MYYAKRFPNFPQVIETLCWSAEYWSHDPTISEYARLFKCERMCKFEELFDWIKARVRFSPDPVGIELIRSPLKVLALDRQSPWWEQGYGDCDDVAVAVAAILLAMNRQDARYGARFVFVRRPYESEPSHVYVEGRHPTSGWVPIDPLFASRPGEIADDLQRTVHYRSVVILR